MKTNLAYIQAGEVMIPALTTLEESVDIGRYGSMRTKFLQQHRRGTYASMVLSGTLNSHLLKVNAQTKERVEKMRQYLLLKNPGPDKQTDPIGWVRYQNQVIAQAEEMVLPEMIYQ